MSPSPGRFEALVASNLMGLILMPTEQCNFRCTYCYEDFVHQRMSAGTVEGIKRWLLRRVSNLDVLTLSWFGGEPMLAFDVVEEVQALALAQARDHRRLNVRASMTTNGSLLTARRLDRLLELGVTRYQISLDGPPEVHDRRRIKAGGQGTFDCIWKNLKAARDSDGRFEMVVRIHVDRDNRTMLPAFLQRLAVAFGGDARFRVFIRQLSRLGGPGDAELPVLAGDEGTRVIAELRQLTQSLDLTQHVGNAPGVACYAAAANSFVVRANGDLAKCTVALSHPNNRVGRIRRDGRLEFDNEKICQWTRGLFSGDAEELRCPMNGYSDPPSLPRVIPLGRRSSQTPASADGR